MASIGIMSYMCIYFLVEPIYNDGSYRRQAVKIMIASQLIKDVNIIQAHICVDIRRVEIYTQFSVLGICNFVFVYSHICPVI